jgi:hypothetical protein
LIRAFADAALEEGKWRLVFDRNIAIDTAAVH